MSDQRLTTPSYLAFPLRIGLDGAATSGRGDHVREQIEQVLFTNPRERVFRPEFGAGVRKLIFEPNSALLRGVVEKRLRASLMDALHGEVDPKTLDILVTAEQEKLLIRIAYVLARIQQQETHEYEVSASG
jgi:uncharacterized protein